MKITLLILALLTLVSSCGNILPPKEKKVVKIAADTAPYVNSFKSTGGIKIDNLEIGFTSSLSGNVLAYCARGTKTVLKFPQNEVYEIQQVVISKAMWDKMGASDREVLVFHELGHCILHRDHTDTRMASGYPASVMNTYHIGGTLYTRSYGHYQAELFNKPTLAGAVFNSDAYRVASTMPTNYSMMASSMKDVSEEMEEMNLYPEASDHNHEDCVKNLGNIVVDERNLPEEENNG